MPSHRPLVRRSQRSALTRPDPVLFAKTVTSFFNSLGFIPVSLLLPIYASSLSSPGTANILVACYNINGSIGSSLTGYASDASLPWTLAVMGTVAGGLALTAWGFGSTLGAVFAFALLFGAFSQVPSCVLSLSLLCLALSPGGLALTPLTPGPGAPPPAT